jgi:thiamine transport system permease protein
VSVTSSRRWLVPALLVIPTAFIGALAVWPLVAVARRAIGGEADLSSLGGVLWFSTWQAAVSTVLTLIVALPAAWLFARVRFVGRRLLWALLVVPFVLPTVVVAAAFTSGPVGELLPRGTVWAVLVAHVFFNYAVVVRVVGVAWAALGTRTAEAAAVLGASRWQVARHVTAPLLAPSVLAASSVVYLFCFTSFGVVLLLGASRLRTVEVEVFERIRSLDLTTAAMLALTQLAVVGVLVWLAGRWSQRWSVPLEPSDTGGLPPVGPGRRAAVALVLGSMGVVVGVPLVSLVAAGLPWWDQLGESRGVLAGTPLEALGNSLVVAAAATTVALVVGGLAVAGIVVAERRSSRRATRRGTAAFDALLMLPLGASAVTVGLGLLLAFNRPPLDLRGTVVLVPLAQALVALPFVVRVLLPAARSVDVRLREAALVLGARPLRALWSVELPLLARPAAVAAGFAFAVALGEFGATLVVARPDLPTLPLTVARLLGQPGAASRGSALALATLLMVVTTVVVLAADSVAGRQRR